MIKHHEGAVEMVEELLEQPGAAYESALFEFTRDVTNDQSAEIERMNELLIGLSADPRAGLAAGFDNAGEAILNLEHVAVAAEAAGFFDPANPANLSPKRLAALAAGDDRNDDAGRATTTRSARKAPAAAALSARRCCRSRTRTWRFAATSWSSAAITASTFIGCKPTTARRSSCRRSFAPAARATSRSSATS